MPISPRARTTLLVLFVFAILVAAGAAAWWFFSQEAPETPLPVVTPELTSIEQVAQYEANKEVPPPTPIERLPAIRDDEHFWGSKTAQVSVVLYGNLSGEYTKLLLPAVKRIVDATNGQVNLIFRNYPLAENAIDYPAAQIAECVYVQKGDTGYWPFVDRVLAATAPTTASLLESAKTPDIDGTVLQTCFDEEHTWDYAAADKQDAQVKARVFVVPSIFVVNRSTADLRFIEGLPSPTYLRSVIAAVQ